ncbi:hypothetical protein YB2330_001493 [Saitoella coloradoensis]
MPRPRRAPKKAPPMPTAAIASTDLPSPINPANKAVTNLREEAEGARPLVSSTPVKEAGGKFREGLELEVSPIRAGGRNVLEDEEEEDLLPPPTTEERELEHGTEGVEGEGNRGAAGAEPSSDDPFGFKSTSRKFGAQLRSTRPKTQPRMIPEAEEEEEEDEEVERVPETQLPTEGGDDEDSELSDAQSIDTDDGSLELLPSSPPKPEPAPKQKKAEVKGKALRTVDLESLLPRRRTRAGKKKGTYDISDDEDEDEEEEDSDDDELAHPRRRKTKRSASSPKKRTEPQKRARTRTRTRTRTVSNREEEDSEPELEATPVVDDKVREESRRVRKQFAEVDKWELEVETVSVDLSSQP